MASEIATLTFAVIGVIFLLLTVIFKLLSWREGTIVLNLPLYAADDLIFERIDSLRMFTELCGIHKRCKIVIINYGAPEWYCEKIRLNFSDCGFLEVFNAEDAAEEINEKIFKEEINK